MAAIQSAAAVPQLHPPAACPCPSPKQLSSPSSLPRGGSDEAPRRGPLPGCLPHARRTPEVVLKHIKGREVAAAAVPALAVDVKHTHVGAQRGHVGVAAVEHEAQGSGAVGLPACASVGWTRSVGGLFPRSQR